MRPSYQSPHMRVLLLANNLDRSEERLVGEIASRGVGIECLLDPAAERRPELERAGVRFGGLVCRNRVDLRAAAKIRAALRRGSFDLVHSLSARTLSCAVVGSVG